jgi:protein required for attachment to host cells
VVADGFEARIFERIDKKGWLQQIEHLSYPRSLNLEHNPDKPGRNHTIATTHTHKHTYPFPDWHKKQRSHFIKKISEKILQSAKENRFDHLILICPSQLIGLFKEDITSLLDKNTLKNLPIDILPKDWTRFPRERIEKELQNLTL